MRSRQLGGEGGAPKVLVVDDEADLIRLCRVNLEFEGYQVIQASDGEEALRLAVTEHPDLILLDVMMPHKDGWQVLDELKARAETSNVPVIMLTVMSQGRDQARAWSTGVADYVTKPFSPVALVACVREALRADPTEAERRRAGSLARLRVLDGDR
jgi:two-component system alkaline phosphatase synthesis response regulator PhoP